MNLQVRPRPKRRWGVLWLAGAIFLLLGLIARQQGWRPEQALANIGQDIIQQAPIANMPQLPQPDPVEEASVVQVISKVVENPRSEAYTANLYSGQAEGIPWANAGGRATIETYLVEEGDTLWSIAAESELDVDTLRWSNPDLERNPDVLPVGAELRILPVVGVYHIVSDGETVETIAPKYGVAEVDITNYPPNGLYPPFELSAGDGLIVPFGRKDFTVTRPSLSGGYALAWPLVGYVTQGFLPDHHAIDIGGPYGATVYAADAGTVIHAEWARTGYGYTIIIDHGEGRQTWYSHLKGALFKAGSWVARGDPIGEVGSTGRSTGPHVHFEVRVNAERMNPLDYLSSFPQ